MLNILQKHLEKEAAFEICVVAAWVLTLNEDEQKIINKLIETRAVVVASLYKDLNSEGVPFKLTAFRAHMRGYCTCQKN